MATVSNLKNKPSAPAKGRLTRASDWVKGHVHATVNDPLVKQSAPVALLVAVTYVGATALANYAAKRIWLG